MIEPLEAKMLCTCTNTFPITQPLLHDFSGSSLGSIDGARVTSVASDYLILLKLSKKADPIDLKVSLQRIENIELVPCTLVLRGPTLGMIQQQSMALRRILRNIREWSADLIHKRATDRLTSQERESDEDLDGKNEIKNARDEEFDFCGSNIHDETQGMADQYWPEKCSPGGGAVEILWRNRCNQLLSKLSNKREFETEIRVETDAVMIGANRVETKCIFQ